MIERCERGLSGVKGNIGVNSAKTEINEGDMARKGSTYLLHLKGTRFVDLAAREGEDSL